MKELLLVAAGGAVGSVLRYKISGLVLHHTTDWRFPAGTFVVNIAGCLAVGILAGLAAHADFFSPSMRLLLITGFLGGFTTFSAFGFETIYLLKRGDVTFAMANVVLSVAAGLLAVWLGMALGSLKQAG